MFPNIWHRYIFLVGLIGLAVGMLFGTVSTSIPQIILAANWLLEKNFSWKWQQLKHNRIFWVMMSLFLIHIIGMLYTQNVSRGLDDLRNKLPLLTFPLILFSTKPLSHKEIKLLFGFFFLSVLISSAYCFFVFEGYTNKVVIDARQASVFMSHIRFSLFMAFAIIGLVYFIVKEEQSVYRSYSVAAITWLLFVMFKLEMATGFICLLISASIMTMVLVFKRLPKKIAFMIFGACVLIFLLVLKQAYLSLNMFEKNTTSKNNILLEQTVNGRYYLNDTLYGLAENGNLIGINISDAELEKEWPKLSALPFNGKDKKGNDLRFTVLHYMASKGLTKDSLGLSLLNKSDINNIEMGVSNVNYPSESGLGSRWRELVWEYIQYKRGENPSGHTLTMRLEFWKTAGYIISNHILFGVGTGDVQDEFNKAYEATHTKLNKEWRLRCHNQYLAITVAFGITGLLVFLFYLFYPTIHQRHQLHYLYWPFFIIVLLSFITEDTLETQSGVSFFIFFQAFFLWLSSFNHKAAS